jgi:hypothetical protein
VGIVAERCFLSIPDRVYAHCPITLDLGDFEHGRQPTGAVSVRAHQACRPVARGYLVIA